METNKTNVETVESGISTLSVADGTKTEFANSNSNGLSEYANGKDSSAKRYYKSFDLPNGVTFHSELASGGSVVSFCDFSADKSLLNMGISHIFLGGGENIGYGKGFSLNLSEHIETVVNDLYYVDEFGDYYQKVKNDNTLERGYRNYRYTLGTGPNFVPEYELVLFDNNYNHMPKQWLSDGRIAKGFDIKGYLRLVCDTCGNYFVLKYNNNHCITELICFYMNQQNYDIFEKNKFTFTYNSNGNLIKIASDIKGSVEYSYTGNELTGIVYRGGLNLTISYSNNKISAIASSDGYNSRFTHDSKTENIIVENKLSKIPNGQTVTASELKKYKIAHKADIKLQNGEAYVTVINDEEYYGFNNYGSLYSYTLEQNSKVVKAEQYNIILNAPEQYAKIYKARLADLNKTSFKDFVFVAGEKAETDIIKDTRLPKETRVTGVPLSDGTTCDYTIGYTYNEDGLCTKEICSIVYNLSYGVKRYAKITEYEYNDKYLPVKKTSYVNGEEGKYGKVIEEYSYDDHGNLTETVSYNSKSETQKFRTKKEYDSYDRPIKEYNETCESFVEYVYEGYCDQVSNVAVTETAGYAEHTKESGVLTYETTEDQEDMSDYYDNMIKIQSKPYDSKTFFARIDVNARGVNFFEERQTAELELHSKKNATGKFKIGTEIYEAKPNHTYRIDLTEKLKTQKNITLWLHNAVNDMEIEFYTSGPEQPKLIISTKQQRMNYGYDNLGRVESVTALDNFGNKLVNGINYTNGEVTKLTSGDLCVGTRCVPTNCGNLCIETEYDNKRRISQTKVGCKVIESVAYSEDTLNGITTKRAQLTYGNEAVSNASATKDGSVITADNYRAEFNADGSISKEIETDKVTGKVTDEITYTYDTFGRLKEAVTKKNEVIKQTMQYSYDDYGKLRSTERSGEDPEYKIYYYTDDSARRLSGELVEDVVKVFYNYDVYGRVIEKSFETTDNCTYIDYQQISYHSTQNTATNRPFRLTYSNGGLVQYHYDKTGNISSIYREDSSCSYYYDKLGRLIEEFNTKFNWTKRYEYDSYGNIKKVTEYELEDDEGEMIMRSWYSPTYDKDRLTSFKGQACVYDDIGNPTTYRGYTALWSGRQLTNYKGTAFTYDARGRRISKGGITFTYDSEGNLIKQSNGLKFFYDCQGVAGFEYNDNIFCYRKDAQGNVIAIVDSNGNAVVKYYYDAWGNQIVEGSNTTLGNLNPFRYRGYYYDTETGLYFLQTRYYDPEVGRFLNMDSTDYADPETVHGLNLYAYCANNPVMYTDPTGCMPNWAKWLIGGVIILGLGIATILTGGASAGVAGFIVFGAFKGAVIGAISGAAVSGLIGGISNALSGSSFLEGLANGAADGFMSGAIIGGITGAISSSVQVANAAKAWANTGAKSGFKQMTEHYAKHVIKEGQKSVAKNIVNYTKQASKFFANNNTSGYLLREGVIKIAGAPGGIFNTNGLIRSFWYIL